MPEVNFVNIVKIGVLDTVAGDSDVILLKDGSVLTIDRKWLCLYNNLDAFMEGSKKCKCIKRKGMK